MDPNSTVPNVPVAPAAPVSEAPAAPPPKSRNKLKIILALFFAVVIFLTTLTGLAYAVAYEKININNKEIQEKVSNFVMALPFSPKTPKYLLTAAAQAHKNLSSHNFDVSLATTSDAFAALNLNQIDIQAKGGVDYGDPKNIKFAINSFITKDFNLLVNKKDKVIYVKLNKFPPILLTFLGIIDSTGVDEVLKNWVSYDTTPLDTEARKKLDATKQEKSITATFVENTIANLSDQRLLSAITQTSENVDNVEAYKLTLKTDKQLIDYLGKKIEDQANPGGKYTSETKLSDTVSDLLISLWIDKKTNYILKLETSFKISYASPTSLSTLSSGITNYPTGGKKTEVSIVGVMKLSDFNKPVSIETPAKSISFEDFYKKLLMLSPSYQNLYGATGSASSSGRLSY